MVTYIKNIRRQTMHLFCEEFFEDDKKRFYKALDALRYSGEMSSLTLGKQIYNIAFSKLPTLPGRAEDIISKVDSGNFEEGDAFLIDSLVKVGREVENLARPSGKIAESDMRFGDFLIFGNAESAEFFVFIENMFVSFDGGYSELSVGEVLSSSESSEQALLIRPSNAFGVRRISFPKNAALSEAQEALVATAEAYIQRGYRCQYDDSRFTRVGGGEFRWQIGIKNPEDYTSDRWGYINCAAYTYELYRTALGMDLGALYTTYNLMGHYRNGGAVGEPTYPYYYKPSGKESEDERGRIEAEFISTLAVGDLVVVRRSNGSGHVMMYIGDGKLTHSSGASYNYNGPAETYEPTVRYLDVSDYLFSPDQRNYVFADPVYITELGIVRPLDAFSGEIPENTRNRIKNMKGIIAEKLCSVKGYRTVSNGDPVTYTFRIYNSNEYGVTLEVRQVISDGAEYVSGDLSRLGDAVLSTVTLAARETKEISYTVKVTAPIGSVISGGGATVGGVKHSSADLLVANTLKEADGAAIAEAVAYFKENNSDKKIGFSLANSIYERAGLGTPFDFDSLEELEADAFVCEDFYVHRDGSRAASIAVPGLFGGRNLQTQNIYSATSKKSSNRVRLPRPHDLVIGDVLAVKKFDSEELYLYTGGGRLADLNTPTLLPSERDIKTHLESLLAAYNYFIILRPSIKNQAAFG